MGPVDTSIDNNHSIIIERINDIYHDSKTIMFSQYKNNDNYDNIYISKKNIDLSNNDNNDNNDNDDNNDGSDYPRPRSVRMVIIFNKIRIKQIYYEEFHDITKIDIIVGYILTKLDTNNSYFIYILEKSCSVENENQIYPINITSEYTRKNIKFTKDTYKLYFKQKYDIYYAPANIHGTAIPIEFLLNIHVGKDDMNGIYGDKIKNHFIILFFKKIINISKITELLILFNKNEKILYVICTNYKNIVFSITNNKNDICYKLNGNTFNIGDNDSFIVDTFEQDNCIRIDNMYHYFLENPFL